MDSSNKDANATAHSCPSRLLEALDSLESPPTDFSESYFSAVDEDNVTNKTLVCTGKRLISDVCNTSRNKKLSNSVSFKLF